MVHDINVTYTTIYKPSNTAVLLDKGLHSGETARLVVLRVLLHDVK